MMNPNTRRDAEDKNKGYLGDDESDDPAELGVRLSAAIRDADVAAIKELSSQAAKEKIHYTFGGDSLPYFYWAAYSVCYASKDDVHYADKEECLRLLLVDVPNLKEACQSMCIQSQVEYDCVMKTLESAHCRAHANLNLGV